MTKIRGRETESDKKNRWKDMKRKTTTTTTATINAERLRFNDDDFKCRFKHTSSMSAYLCVWNDWTLNDFNRWNQEDVIALNANNIDEKSHVRSHQRHKKHAQNNKNISKTAEPSAIPQQNLPKNIKVHREQKNAHTLITQNKCYMWIAKQHQYIRKLQKIPSAKMSIVFFFTEHRCAYCITFIGQKFQREIIFACTFTFLKWNEKKNNKNESFHSTELHREQN